MEEAIQKQEFDFLLKEYEVNQREMAIKLETIEKRINIFTTVVGISITFLGILIGSNRHSGNSGEERQQKIVYIYSYEDSMGVSSNIADTIIAISLVDTVGNRALQNNPDLLGPHGQYQFLIPVILILIGTSIFLIGLLNFERITDRLLEVRNIQMKSNKIREYLSRTLITQENLRQEFENYQNYEMPSENRKENRYKASVSLPMIIGILNSLLVAAYTVFLFRFWFYAESTRKWQLYIIAIVIYIIVYGYFYRKQRKKLNYF